MYESKFMGMVRGMMVEGEMEEEGGMERGGEGIAPDGRKESESRLDMVSIGISTLFGAVYHLRANIDPFPGMR